MIFTIFFDHIHMSKVFCLGVKGQKSYLRNHVQTCIMKRLMSPFFRQVALTLKKSKKK